MRRCIAAAGLAACILGVSGCTNDGNSSPTNPTGSSAAPAGALTISIGGINGSMSFSPNPASVPAGQIVVWHNVDGVSHRVVLNDGSVDTGNLDPGASSRRISCHVSRWSGRTQQRDQAFAGARQPRHHRADWRADDGGDLFVGQPFEFTQHDHFTKIGGQSS